MTGMFLTVKQVAERLVLSPAAVYQLCNSGQLAHVRIGLGRGRIRIDEKALEEYLRAGQVEAQVHVEAYTRPRVSPGIDMKLHNEAMRQLRAMGLDV